jgi:CBS-domain-containing membrane protein
MVASNAKLDDVIATMAENQIRRVLVVDDDGCCTGIIAQADIAFDGQPRQAAELVREVSREGGAR